MSVFTFDHIEIKFFGFEWIFKIFVTKFIFTLILSWSVRCKRFDTIYMVYSFRTKNIIYKKSNYSISKIVEKLGFSSKRKFYLKIMWSLNVAAILCSDLRWIYFGLQCRFIVLTHWNIYLTCQTFNFLLSTCIYMKKPWNHRMHGPTLWPQSRH